VSVGRLVLILVTLIVLGAAAEVALQLRSWRAGEQVEQSVAAPDAAHVARVVSVREPGRTGKPYLVVRLGGAGTPGKAMADSGVLWLENALDVTIRWDGPRRLIVEYPAWASVDGREPRVSGVRVTAIPVDSIEPTWIHERQARHRASVPVP
jgi:hypothetical protein